MPIRPSEIPDEQLRRWQQRREAVGARIRELRLQRGLTQESLALEARMARNMVIGVEWGRKSLAYERLWDIADVLEVDLVDLLAPPASPPARDTWRGGRRRFLEDDGTPPA